MKKCLTFVLLFLLTFSVLYAENDELKRKVEEQLGTGTIDWERGVVIATGYGAYNLKDRNVGRGRLMALRAAEIDAKRNLLETIEGVRITSETLVKNFQTESDVIYSQVSGFIRGARRDGEARYNSDGTVEVDVAVPLYGENGLINILAPNLGFSDVEWEEISNPVFTGLVVKIEDEDVRPMMSPVIVNENGTVIYSANKVDKDYAIKQGIVGYSTDVSDAKDNDRVADNPLVVTAKKVDGDKIVLENSDADKILDAKDKLTFIEQCRVMFVLSI